jgi:hypothetical protein
MNQEGSHHPADEEYPEQEPDPDADFRQDYALCRQLAFIVIPVGLLWPKKRINRMISLV